MMRISTFLHAGHERQQTDRVLAPQAGLFWLYYQPLLPAVAMLWMWAGAVRLFEARSIKYDVCFSARDQPRLLPSRSIAQVRSCASQPVRGE